jgi:hypothetical protein
VLSVVAERRVRGAVERTYVLRAAAARISPDEVARMTPAEHRQTFLAFIAGLIGDFDRYLARGDVDPVRDGVSFNMAAMWLTDTEFLELGRELYAVLQPRLANAPTPERRRQLLATVLMPGGDRTARESAADRVPRPERSDSGRVGP